MPEPLWRNLAHDTCGPRLKPSTDEGLSVGRLELGPFYKIFLD